jgi:hypothetical protein
VPWFKVDDGFAFHRKAIKAGNAALGLWVRAGSWCAHQLTDGIVPSEVLPILGGTEVDADALVSSGLWDRTDDGYEFRGWHEYQPMRNEVEANRFATRERQSVFRNPELRQAVRDRDGNVCRYCGQAVQFTDRRGSLGGTYDHIDPKGGTVLENLVVCCRGCNASKGRRTPKQAGMTLQPSPKSVISPVLDRIVTSHSTPSLPDPSLPVPIDIETARIPRAGNKGIRIPEPFTVDEAMKDWAVERRMNPTWVMRQTERFVNYWTAQPGQKGVKTDWRATWRNWLLKAQDDAPAYSAPVDPATRTYAKDDVRARFQ